MNNNKYGIYQSIKTMEQDQTREEQIEIRLQNLELVKQIIEQEIYLLLQEKEAIKNRRPIGFKINQHNNGEKTEGQESTS